MASNEHKNLTDINRHNPKGLEGAQNSTLLSKGLGTPGISDGSLEWISKSNIKTRKVTMSGYCTLNAEGFYSYPEPQSYGQSPYDINQDYGSATISSETTVSQKKFFRIGQMSGTQAGTINNGRLQVTSPDATAFTVALVQYAPSSGESNAYPLVLIEKSAAGLSNDNLVQSYSLVSSDFAETEIGLGNHVFLMIKANAVLEEPPLVYVNMSIEVGYIK
mgnify:CR=1 FL=1|tara:strand:- start:472 stop:1128 length:657 start_codon:yes stop_codon:yes gene_type:complete